MKLSCPRSPRTILVPVDFSDPSREALEYAVCFAKPIGAEIVLSHVVETVLAPPDVVVDTAVLATTLNEAATKRLAEWRDEAATQANVKEDLRTGTPYREIIDAAEQLKADLIVMGTHGRGGLARLVIGSTAERVVRHAPCPVLVVRTRSSEPRSALTEASEAGSP